jgi:hypothetical protein
MPATMPQEGKYTSMNPWSRGRNDRAATAGFAAEPFRQDGWVAMLVLAQGRVYDWLPWCAYASLLVNPSREPTIEDVPGTRLLTTNHDKRPGTSIQARTWTPSASSNAI